MLLETERAQVAQACRDLERQGLVVGTAGNVSVRVGDLVAISPSGLPYADLTPELVGVHELDGAPVEAPLEPSSELPLHLAVYASGTALAVTHTHAPASTALGLVVEEVPTSHYYSALFGGALRVAPYAPFGSDELARNVSHALRDRMGALMKNHGAITVGPTLEKAFSLLPYLEYLCEVHLKALATGLPVATLSEQQIAHVTILLEGYGQDAAQRRGINTV